MCFRLSQKLVSVKADTTQCNVDVAWSQCASIFRKLADETLRVSLQKYTPAHLCNFSDGTDIHLKLHWFFCNGTCSYFYIVKGRRLVARKFLGFFMALSCNKDNVTRSRQGNSTVNSDFSVSDAFVVFVKKSTSDFRDNVLWILLTWVV